MSVKFNDILQSLMVIFIGWTALNTHQTKIQQAVMYNELSNIKIEHIEFKEKDDDISLDIKCLNERTSELETRVVILDVRLNAIKEDEDQLTIKEE